MTVTLTREEAQQVLDALENIAADLTKTTWGAYELQKQLIETFRARLAQPDVPEVCFGNTEPVAWFSKRPDNTIAIKISGKPTEGNWEPLYIAPPQREWQGLTKEEIKKLSDDCAGVRDEIEFIRAIEQALKEKNT